MDLQFCDSPSNITYPLVTIITAVYNGVETIQRCIDSVSKQTYLNREYIIIDGGSTDGTLDILKQNTNKINFWLSEPDRGIYDAWNKALLRARGEWICFLGVDDFFWKEDVLEKLLPYLRKAVPSTVKLVYGRAAILDKHDSLIKFLDESWESAKDKMQNLVLPIPHPGLMHHRSWFEKYGYFDASFQISGDYELLLRGWPHEDAIYVDDVTVVGIRLGGVSSTHKGRMTIMNECRKIQKKYQIKPTMQYRSMVFGNYLRAALIAVLGERSTYTLLDAKRKIIGQPLLWTKL